MNPKDPNPYLKSLVFCMAFLFSIPTQAISIKFDYRFDGGYFSKHPKRKKTLEAAARVWEEILPDDFPEIPIGTVIKMVDPVSEEEHLITLNEPIDDIIIFVFADDFDGEISPRARGGHRAQYIRGSELDLRYNEYPFQPWLGRIRFNTSVDWYFDADPSTNEDHLRQAARGKRDFFTTAMHEITHVLGMTRTKVGWFVEDDHFYGENALKVHGAPIPMKGGHINIPRKDRPKPTYLMVPSRSTQRSLPTPLELAILQDLGYHPIYENIPDWPVLRKD